MTEQVLAESNLQNQTASNSAPVNPAQNVSHETSPVDKTLSQKEVNEIVGRAKADAEQRGYERAKREYTSAPSSSVAQPQVSQPQQTMGGIAQPSDADLQKMIDQRLQHMQTQQEINNFAMQFENKVKQGYQKYDDFGDVLREVNPVELAKTNPGFIFALGGVDNPHDVLKDLRDNPQKLAALLQLSGHPATQAVAQKQLMALSDSIKQNETAANQKNANEPLSQVKPSTTGTDNGSMSGVREFKKASWLRA